MNAAIMRVMRTLTAANRRITGLLLAVATMIAMAVPSGIAMAAPAATQTQPAAATQTAAAQAAAPADTKAAAAETPAGPDNKAAGTAKIGVLSDTHYYPANYADDNDDFHDYVGGDPKLLEESNAISEQAVQMIIKDHPDYVLVTGDLTKDGEQQAEYDIAAKFREIETKTAEKYGEKNATKVFVINGNHDIYNTDAWNFHEGTGQREPAPSIKDSEGHTFIGNDPHFQTTDSTGKAITQGATDPAYFRYVMRDFGYDEAAQQDKADRAANSSAPSHFFHNPGNDNTDFNSADHYRTADGTPKAVAGELSYYVDEGDYRFIAIDSGRYSPDAETGYDYNEHVTAGRVDPTLLPWIASVTKDADAKGKTVIGFLHHGIVPHFVNEDKTLNEYVVDNWQQVASTLADAGMRWVFTGHMHANDRADYVSPKGNPLVDIQTGALASYGTPVRYVTFYRGQKLPAETAGGNGERHAETMDVKTVSVGRDPENPSKHVTLTVHCGYGVTLPADPSGRWTQCNTADNTQQINDLEAYTKQKLYGSGLITNMAVGTVRPMLEKIGKQGLQNYLAKEQPDFDLKQTVLDYLREYMASPMTITGGMYTAQAWYANGGLHLKGIGGVAQLLGETTISDDEIMAIVGDLMSQIDTQYLQQPDYLAGVIKQVVDKISAMQPVAGSDYALVAMVSDLMTNHLQGAENTSGVNRDKIAAASAAIKKGNLVKDIINLLLETIVPQGGNGVLDHITSTLTVRWNLGLSGLWLTVLNLATSNGNLKSTLDTFGFNAAKIRSIVDDKVNEYMSPSFLTGMGGIIGTIIDQMSTDSVGEDDVENSGKAVTIAYTGHKTPFDPDDTAAGSGQPTQISMSLGKDTVKDRAFRWYARSFYDTSKVDEKTHAYDTVTEPGKVQVCRDAGCDSVISTVDATAEQVVKPKTLLNLGLTSGYGKDFYTKYSAQVTGLTVGQPYYYRVSSGDFWSSTTRFVTGSSDDTKDSFSFLNVDDSQGMTQSDYDTYHKTLTAAQSQLPGTAFTVHGGDVVDEGSNEDYWTWLLDGDQERSMAVTAATGNHEDKSHVEGVSDPNSIMSHFNIQNLDVPDQDQTSGTYYSYTYKNALFVVLNSNDLAADDSISSGQMAWAQKTVSSSDAKWKIIVLHKSPYSNGPHHADADVVAIRAQLTKFAANNHIDLVLSGHDHTYNRTDFLDRNGKKTAVTTKTQAFQGQNFQVAQNPNGVVYAIAGTAGVKNYEQHDDPAVESAVSLALNVPAYAGVNIDGDTLYYRAYKVENGASQQIDSFAISKAATAEKTAAEKVIDQIAALPAASDVETGDEAAIVAAETAYNALSAADKAKVTNHDKLVADRAALDALKAADSGQTVNACDAGSFKSALGNAGVSKIVLCGDFEIESGWFVNDSRRVYLNHPVTIVGDGRAHTIAYAEIGVNDNARLVLDGTNGGITINDVRAGGSIWTSAQPVVLGTNATLITRGTVTLQTKYGTGSDNGYAVNVSGAGANAIIGKGTTLIGAGDGGYGLKVGQASGSATIDGGQIYGFGPAGVNSGSYGGVLNNGRLTVNDGTVSSVDSRAGSTLTINGGTFKDISGGEVNQSARVVVGSGVNAYITGGSIEPLGGQSILNNGTVSMMPDAAGNLALGNGLAVKPFVGTVASRNSRDASAAYVKLGDGRFGERDGIYQAGDAGVSSLESLAADAAAAKRLTDSKSADGADGNATITATLPAGSSTVYAKLLINGHGVDGITGGGEYWVYGKSAAFENNPVTAVVIDSADPFVANLNNSTTFGLSAHVEPDNAHDLSLDWTSSDESTVTVDDATGIARVLKPGDVTVTAKSKTYPDAKSDSTEFIAVKPTISGTNGEMGEETAKLGLSASTGIDGSGSGSDATIGKHKVSWQWSVDRTDIATIDPATGVLTKSGTGESGTVTVIARLVLDGTATDATAFRTIKVTSLAAGQYMVEWYKHQGGQASFPELPADKWTAPAAPSGKVFAGWYADPAFKDPYMKTSGKAYAKFVDAKLMGLAAQVPAGLDVKKTQATYLRAMSTMDTKRYAQAGFDFHIPAVDGVAAHTVTLTTDMVWNRADLKGSGNGYYTPQDANGFGYDFGPSAQYWTVAFLTKIPQAYFDKDMIVDVWWKTLDGTTVHTPHTQPDGTVGYRLNIAELAGQSSGASQLKSARQ
ncbi:metallophosphoesterase [Bifidobacterium leontopitheci]|uniref:Calcineurin-like phosphoesterase n=1 Tax=Bifidobacterium leontopitheci TaxID=2650774 RepID=A0A6I1GE86_9BIFI|nr:metallophosphoesterase [Bifidobacterium leontopitheci]KAB7789002.1 Calcineurin-like phosphoesterase [Bifidobacterium leontopitheci]